MRLLYNSRPLFDGRSREPRIGARLRLEGLEDRAVPAVPADVFHPMVIAGSPRATPADAPDDRVDPNTTSSPYAGVGSIQVVTNSTSFIATGTVIGKRYVLTAAHVVDLNNDGKVDRKDGTQGVYFILNAGGNQTAKIAVTGFNLAPDFTGFNRPSVNDDLAILTLAEDVPADVPIYNLPTEDMAAGTVLTFVGYGRSGDGIRGYTTAASPTIKRVGENTADAFYGQDDRGRPAANEVFRFDFDGPTGKGPLGGPTLGNDRETQLGGGDSGGPAFETTDGGSLVLAGVTAFTQGATAPRFGSMGGGVNLYPYLSFINSILYPSDGPSSSPPSSGSSSTGVGVGVGANPLRNPIRSFPPPSPPPSVPPPPPPGPTFEPPPVQPPPPPVDVPPPPPPGPTFEPPPVQPPPPPVDDPPPDPIIDRQPTDPVKEPDNDGTISLISASFGRP